jgi:hypothetical protein
MPQHSRAWVLRRDTCPDQIPENHQGQLGKPVDEATTLRLLETILYRDTILALTVFYFLIDPSTYIPKPGKDFSVWRRPITKLEFDHAGGLTRLPSQKYLHEGGESKYSHSRANLFKTSTDKCSEVGRCETISTKDQLS